MKQYFAGLSRNSFLLAAASFFADTSTEMLYPVLPVFLTRTLRASGSIVGLVEGFAQAAQNIVQGFSGALSDRLQKRKGIALAGYLAAAIAKPLMGISTAWQGVFSARLLDRVGSGTRSAPRDALIASSVDEKVRGKAFGLEGIGDNTGAFVGPLFAIFLLYSLHVGIRTIFYLAIIPGLLAFVMVLLVTERRAAVTAKSKMDVNLRQFPSGYWKYLSVIALFGLGNSSNSFLILRTQDIGAPLGDDDLDVCSVQPCRRTHFVSRGLLLRQIGKKKCPARLVYHFCAHLYWLRQCTECPNFRCTVYLLRSISGNISGSRKSIRIRFCSRKFTSKRSRMVQQHRRVVGTGGERRSRTALGPSRPRRCVLLWSDVRVCW